MLSFLPNNSQDVMKELKVKFKERVMSMVYIQMECLGEFTSLCDGSEDMPKSMDDVLKKETK